MNESGHGQKQFRAVQKEDIRLRSVVVEQALDLVNLKDATNWETDQPSFQAKRNRTYLLEAGSFWKWILFQQSVSHR